MSPQQDLVAKSGTDLGPVDLSSDVSLAASSGQEWYWLGSGWPELTHKMQFNGPDKKELRKSGFH